MTLEDVMRETGAHANMAVTLSWAPPLLVFLTLSSNLLGLLTRNHGWTTRINVIWSQVRQLRQRWHRNWSRRYMRNKGGVAWYIRNSLTVVKCLSFNLTLNHLHKFASPNGTPLFSMRNLFPTQTQLRGRRFNGLYNQLDEHPETVGCMRRRFE